MQQKSSEKHIDKFINANYNEFRNTNERREEIVSFEYSELIKLMRYKYETQDNFAKALGIGRVSLSRRLNNKLEFTQEEILKAAKLLEIPKEEIPYYFFNEKVQKHERKENA